MRVAEYLIKSLEILGITDIFGLPGDYNFNILYAIENNPNVNWVGCVNELNAGYSADGYARVRGYGAIVTTYGVGELSAMNAIAGSYSENVPVISIVGVPTTQHIKNNVLLHHNFQQPDYYAFEKAHRSVVETTAYLTKENAKSEIDRIISVMVKTRRPVYVAIPMDICLEEITDDIGFKKPQSNKENLKSAVDRIKKMVEKSANPALLAGMLLKRYQLEESFKKLVEKKNYPVSNFIMGMGIVNQSTKNYVGTYLSEFGNDCARQTLFNTDCLISFGGVYSDLNTFGFSLPYELEDFISIYGTYTVIEQDRYDDVMMEDLLEELIKCLPSKSLEIKNNDVGYEPSNICGEKLSSKYIYPRLQEFFREDDCIFMETGIIPHGFSGVRLPDNVLVNTQTLWGSIGWATPATFGACIALKNSKRRVILFTGDGSHQLTATEVSNMMHHNLKPIVMVLNNNGYTIERILSNSPEDKFNNIISWDYSKLPEAFKGEVYIKQAKTDEDFDTVLKDSQNQDKMCYFELFTDEMDIPYITQKTIEKLKG
jgi:indolepyruvate decarboxylase